MAVVFPPNPNVGDELTGDFGEVYTWDGTKWTLTVGTGGGGTSVVIGDTPPASPSPGDLWWDTVSGQLFIFYTDADSSQWVIANSPVPDGGGGGGGSSVVISDTAPVSPVAGMLWWATDVAKLFFWDGSQWVIVVNTPEGGGGPPMGVTDGSDAAPGEIGEYIVNYNAPVALPSGTDTFTQIGVLDLTPGDWQVSGYIVLGLSANILSTIIGSMLLDGNLYPPQGGEQPPGGIVPTLYFNTSPAGQGAIGTFQAAIAPFRLNITAATEVGYEVGVAFTTVFGTVTGQGILQAWRMR